VSSELTVLAKLSADEGGGELKVCLEDIMRRLSKAQGEGDFGVGTAPRHFATVLGELLVDHLEHLQTPDTFVPHGNWLGVEPAGAGAAGLAAHMNGLLLTSSISPTASPFGPGTVYLATDATAFGEKVGKEPSALIDLCCKRPARLEEWRASAKPVLVEISPECDVAQGHRTSAFLIAGLVVPASLAAEIKSAPSLTTMPSFHLRQSLPDFPQQDVALVFCHRYKATVPVLAPSVWLQPWFRFRELPTAALRNAHASQSSRVGYVSL
jgi:hypothetical protein